MFTFNSFKVFFRTYPKWSIKCQKVHSTSEIGNLAKGAGEIQPLTRKIRVTNIILLSIVPLGILISDKAKDTTPDVYEPIALLLESAALITQMIFYQQTLNAMNSVDLNIL
jgi:hypothetical protein